MRWLIVALVTLVVLLQYRLWVGRGSLAEVITLKQEIADQQAELKALRARNRSLHAEVTSLKNGLEAVEERARAELGMIRKGEVFYQVLDEPMPGVVAKSK
jgi:cell division protein FtsB